MSDAEARGAAIRAPSSSTATFKTNVHVTFLITKAATPHLQPGSAIINTSSVNSRATLARRDNPRLVIASLAKFQYFMLQMPNLVI
jgi:NAD(P)-dependent dehydrogenase (short-subunit alcohol dehydrogenase family)